MATVDGAKWIDLYSRMIQTMEAAFQVCEASVPPAVIEKHGNHSAYRFQEKSIQQAIVMKLSYIVSTLRAALILHLEGYSIQQGALQRMVDEASEDVAFLSHAVIENDLNEHHQYFLDAFWAEEFSDPADPLGTHVSRPMLKRQRIQVYLNARTGPDPSTGNAAMKVLTKGYSGFVHAAAPHLMDVYGGTPPSFHVRGVRRMPVHWSMLLNLWDYVYRGYSAHAMAAIALKHQALSQNLLSQMVDFEGEAGKHYSPQK